MIVQSGITMTSETSKDVIYNKEDFTNGNVNMIVSIPFKVEFAHKVAQISLGKTFMLFLTDRSELYSMGTNAFGELGMGN